MSPVCTSGGGMFSISFNNSLVFTLTGCIFSETILGCISPQVSSISPISQWLFDILLIKSDGINH